MANDTVVAWKEEEEDIYNSWAEEEKMVCTNVSPMWHELCLHRNDRSVDIHIWMFSLCSAREVDWKFNYQKRQLELKNGFLFSFFIILVSFF